MDYQNQTPHEQDMDLLRSAKASWQQDGKGIRGDATVVSHTKGQLVWDSIPVARRANLEQPIAPVDATIPDPTIGSTVTTT